MRPFGALKSAAALADALVTNTTLGSLELGHNTMLGAGTRTLARALPNCASLTRLGLRSNGDAEKVIQGWVQEMWGYSIAAASHGIVHSVHRDFQAAIKLPDNIIDTGLDFSSPMKIENPDKVECHL